MKLDVKQTAYLLKSADDILVLSHKNPDGDTLGSAFALINALELLGKNVRFKCNDPIPKSFKFLAMGHNMKKFEPQFIVAVDVADVKLLGDNVAEYTKCIDLCIDHHISNLDFATDTLLQPQAAATCELMYSVIEELGVDIDKKIADCLYTGISTDTGCFKFSNTTAHTHTVAAKLIDYGADFATINREIFDTKTRARLEFEQLLIHSMEFYYEQRLAVITITREMLDATGIDESEIDGVSGLARSIEGVEVGVTIREKLDGVHKISLRTSQHINASQVCKRLGGGGHIRAAGCSIKGTLKEVKKTIVEEIGIEFAK